MIHLQHGPIDLVCRAWGEPEEVAAAYAQAEAAFPAILPGLCARRRALSSPLSLRERVGVRGVTEAILNPGRPAHCPPHPNPLPRGEGEVIARAMIAACLPHAATWITPMAAVAGAVADRVLHHMTRGRRLTKAFVNNGGDIAFHLAPGMSLACALVTNVETPTLDGRFVLTPENPSRGIATSGRACRGQGGRSFSRGIADSVTILARTAAEADAAATVVANAVDLPGHPAIHRRPADTIDPDSDLGPRLVTWTVGALTASEIDQALGKGQATARNLIDRNVIQGAVLALQGRIVSVIPVHA